MFYDNLIKIQQTLKEYKRPKNELVVYYINKRLNDSLNSYYSDLRSSMKYIINRKPENVIRKL